MSLFTASAQTGLSLVVSTLLITSCTSATTSSGSAPSEETAGNVSEERTENPTESTEQNSKPQTDSPYINSLLPEARRIENEYDIPVDLTLAIAIQETGWGKAEIGKNNHFGLRCASDDCITLNKGGKSIRYETCPDESECFDMFARSIQEMSEGTPNDVRELYRNGYATSPRWVRKVRKIRRQVRKTLASASQAPSSAEATN